MVALHPFTTKQVAMMWFTPSARDQAQASRHMHVPHCAASVVASVRYFEGIKRPWHLPSGYAMLGSLLLLLHSIDCLRLLRILIPVIRLQVPT